jgi:transcriptional regulator with XRE-family HTH domain
LLASRTPLAFYRKRAGLTALAKRAAIAQGFVSEIEAGRKSSDTRALCKIADALQLPLDDLVVSEIPVASRQSKKAAR